MEGVQDCLVIEDHPQARAWLVKAVRAAFPDVNCREAAAVATAEAMIADRLPDLALVDLGLPDGNGRTLIELLDARRAADGGDLKIVVSTVMNDDESIFSALRAGADGYILKEEELATLIDMLQGISTDKPPLSPDIAMRVLQHFKREKPEESPLSPRERQILQLLAKGYTVARTAEMLGITYHTTSSYVRDIYRKLNITSRAEATLEASRRGLV